MLVMVDSLMTHNADFRNHSADARKDQVCVCVCVCVCAVCSEYEHTVTTQESKQKHTCTHCTHARTHMNTHWQEVARQDAQKHPQAVE